MDLIRFDRADHHPVTFAFVANRNFPDSDFHRAVCKDRHVGFGLRPKCAPSGHSLTAWRTGQVHPKRHWLAKLAAPEPWLILNSTPQRGNRRDVGLGYATLLHPGQRRIRVGGGSVTKSPSFFTDMVGFTTFSNFGPGRAAFTLMQSLAKPMEDAVRAQGKREGFTGDGIMASLARRSRRGRAAEGVPGGAGHP